MTLKSKLAVAVDSARTLLGIEKPPSAQPAGATAAKNAPPAPLVVWSIAPRNRRLVIAHRVGDDPTDPTKLLTVIVRDNVRFLRGMEVPGPGRALVATGDRAFALQGALPRWRGRW